MTAVPIPEVRTVLVVADADAPDSVSGEVLTSHGFAVPERVDSLAAAATRLRTKTFDLVILPIDNADPGVLSLIEHDIRPIAPFIIGTAADATQDLILGALRAGIPEFVPAPIRAEELEVAIRRLLRRMDSTPSTEPTVATLVLASFHLPFTASSMMGPAASSQRTEMFVAPVAGSFFSWR